jgi:RNA 2',3'-cyclic 3'-phosphodiesterase
MSVIRAFIAIDLTSEIVQHLEQVSAQLRKRLEGVPVRWVPVDNIHLTLKFLGDVSLANVDILKKILQTEVEGHHAFEISVGGLGAFPSPRRPRVVWVGVEAPAELTAVQSGVENSMARLGYAREERPFSPHLTLGRVSRNAVGRDERMIGEAIEGIKLGFLGVARVSEVHLYKSDLQPNGAVYTRLFTAPLKE